MTRLSLLTALSVVFLFLGSVMPTGKIALAVIAGFGVCVALMMYGYGWALAVFGVTALLAALLFPGGSAILYGVFFGYYPIAKSLFEKLHSKAAVWACKYALYTVVFVAYCLLAQALFTVSGRTLAWYVLYPLGACVFWLYDRCFSLLIAFYIDRIARYFP